MSKWTIIVPHVFDELKYTGGLLSTLLTKQHVSNLELSTEERPYVIFCSIADEDSVEKGHISVSQFYRELYESSQLLKFNYKVIYKGRDYHNNLDGYYGDLASKLIKEIKFSRPQWLIVPSSINNSTTILDSNFLTAGLCSQDIYFNNLYRHVPNLISYNKNLDFGNFYIEIERGLRKINSVDTLGSAYSLYKSRLTSSFSDTDFEYKYYSLSRCGTRINKEFAESYIVEHMSFVDDIISFVGLNVKEYKESNLKIEDII